MSFATIEYKKYIEKYFKNDKYNFLRFNQKKYFLQQLTFTNNKYK